MTPKIWIYLNTKLFCVWDLHGIHLSCDFLPFEYQTENRQISFCARFLCKACIVNNQIDLSDLTTSVSTFKNKMKKSFKPYDMKRKCK